MIYFPCVNKKICLFWACSTDKGENYDLDNLGTGCWYSVVLGNEKYYSRAGYSLARKYGILAPFGVPDEKFMVCKLLESAPSVSGVVQYAKEFGID